jgi:hypothetical protein
LDPRVLVGGGGGPLGDAGQLSGDDAQFAAELLRQGPGFGVEPLDHGDRPVLADHGDRETRPNAGFAHRGGSRVHAVLVHGGPDDGFASVQGLTGQALARGPHAVSGRLDERVELRPVARMPAAGAGEIFPGVVDGEELGAQSLVLHEPGQRGLQRRLEGLGLGDGDDQVAEIGARLGVDSSTSSSGVAPLISRTGILYLAQCPAPRSMPALTTVATAGDRGRREGRSSEWGVRAGVSLDPQLAPARFRR